MRASTFTDPNPVRAAIAWPRISLERFSGTVMKYQLPFSPVQIQRGPVRLIIVTASACDTSSDEASLPRPRGVGSCLPHTPRNCPRTILPGCPPRTPECGLQAGGERIDHG